MVRILQKYDNVCNVILEKIPSWQVKAVLPLQYPPSSFTLQNGDGAGLPDGSSLETSRAYRVSSSRKKFTAFGGVRSVHTLIQQKVPVLYNLYITGHDKTQENKMTSNLKELFCTCIKTDLGPKIKIHQILRNCCLRRHVLESHNQTAGIRILYQSLRRSLWPKL